VGTILKQEFKAALCGRAALNLGLMTDDERAPHFEPFLIHRGGRPPRNHRRVLDAVFWLMRTGAPWRDLPEEFGNWNSIFRQFRRWADSGVWDVILEALQIIDATVIRAHHCASGGKGGPGATRSSVRAASRPRSKAAPTPKARRWVRDHARPEPRRHALRPGCSTTSTAIPSRCSATRDTRAKPLDGYRASWRRRIRTTASRATHAVDKSVYALRNRIERFFNRAKNSRRAASRYDKLIETFAAFMLPASIRIQIALAEATRGAF
jgi:transposase